MGDDEDYRASRFERGAFRTRVWLKLMRFSSRQSGKMGYPKAFDCKRVRFGTPPSRYSVSARSMQSSLLYF